MHLKKALILTALCASPAFADASVSVEAGGQRVISRATGSHGGTVTTASGTFKTSPLSTKSYQLPFDLGLELRPEGAWGTVDSSQYTSFANNASVYACYKFAWFSSCIDAGPSVIYIRNHDFTRTLGGYQGGVELSQGFTEDTFIKAAWHGAEYAPAKQRVRTSEVTLGMGYVLR